MLAQAKSVSRRRRIDARTRRGQFGSSVLYHRMVDRTDGVARADFPRHGRDEILDHMVCDVVSIERVALKIIQQAGMKIIEYGMLTIEAPAEFSLALADFASDSSHRDFFIAGVGHHVAGNQRLQRSMCDLVVVRHMIVQAGDRPL